MKGIAVKEPQIWRQQKWQDDELRTLHFRPYETRRQLRMARVVEEASTVDTTKEELIAEAGYMLCYTPGTEVRANLVDYDQWPVRFDLFHKNYSPWPQEGWQPNPVEKHLMENGCRPYFKSTPVWARRLQSGVMVESLESKQPVRIPAGRWLVIGIEGEPYHTADAKFRQQYVVPDDSLPEHLYWSIRRMLGRVE
jgi:hypothetical protein